MISKSYQNVRVGTVEKECIERCLKTANDCADVTWNGILWKLHSQSLLPVPLSFVKRGLLPPTKEEVNVFARVCLSVCLSVSKVTQKRVHGFR